MCENNREVVFGLLLQPSVGVTKARRQQKVDGVHLLCFHRAAKAPKKKRSPVTAALSASRTASSLGQTRLSAGPVGDVTRWQVNTVGVSFISPGFFVLFFSCRQNCTFAFYCS